MKTEQFQQEMNDAINASLALLEITPDNTEEIAMGTFGADGEPVEDFNPDENVVAIRIISKETHKQKTLIVFSKVSVVENIPD